MVDADDSCARASGLLAEESATASNVHHSHAYGVDAELAQRRGEVGETRRVESGPQSRASQFALWIRRWGSACRGGRRRPPTNQRSRPSSRRLRSPGRAVAGSFSVVVVAQDGRFRGTRDGGVTVAHPSVHFTH
jgi:hypothetical protein